jgi:hypothetical protein
LADYLGIRAASSTVRFSFTTHAASGAVVAPSNAFESADLDVYKDGSATPRSSAAGITMTSAFASTTGLHHVDIDLSDNTDAGFYAAGSFYTVVITPDETVDSLAVVKVLAYFDIGVPVANVTQISGDATAADNLENLLDDTAGAVHHIGIVDQGTAQSVGATDIVLRAAAAFIDDGLNGATVVITNGTQIGSRAVITDYVGATDTATIAGWPGATPSGTPTYKIFASAPSAAATQASVDAIDNFVDDLEGRLTAALATKLAAHAAAALVLVVDAGSTTTAVVFKTVEGGAPSATNDFYNGRVIIFTSGALAGQATAISDYVGATVTATVVATTGAPAEDVTAIIS